jgi:L-seryl-tRNA(Ser) seleniumtransferase
VRAPVGGGSLPGYELTGHALAIRGPLPVDEFQSRLRQQLPPVLARVQGDVVLIDPRTVFDDQIDPLIQALIASLR